MLLSNSGMDNYQNPILTQKQFSTIRDYIRNEQAEQLIESKNLLRPKSYEGIGLCGKFNQDGFVVEEVFLGSNAHEQGIKSGDIITSIIKQGEPIKLNNPNLSDLEKVNLIRGKDHPQNYQILSDGIIKTIMITPLKQNGFFKATESISSQMKLELLKKQQLINQGKKITLPPFKHNRHKEKKLAR